MSAIQLHGNLMFLIALAISSSYDPEGLFKHFLTLML